MNPGTAGNLCSAEEMANLREVFQASAGTNYMVYRKSVLKFAVLLLLSQVALSVLGINDSTRIAQDIHSGEGTIVIDPQVQADCMPLCSTTASEVVQSVNDSFAEAAADSHNSSSKFVPWDAKEVEATALTTCLSLCVGSRTPALPTQLIAGGTCRLDVNASVATNSTIVSCGQKERPPPSRLEYRLALIELSQRAVAAVITLACLSLFWASVVSWRHFRSSMRYICLMVFGQLGKPYFVSLVPWYELFSLNECMSDSFIYGLSPDLADFEIRSRVTLPVYLSLQSGLLALFPALSYASVTAKTFDPSNSFLDALLVGVPVFLLTFNWPIWALIYQLTGSSLILVGGLLFAGSRLVFTCYFKKITFSDDTAETIKLLQNLNTAYLAGLCLGSGLIVGGAFLNAQGFSEQLLGDLMVSPMELVGYVLNYYVEFYVSYIAAADLLVFGTVHFGSKRLSYNQLEEEAAGLAASYSALTCEEAVFRGGHRLCFFRFPV